MSDVYSFHPGSTPLLISVPHDGWQVPADILRHMTGAARGIPDTDWHVSQLYDFASDIGASVIVANYSRYVVDLNRSADDASLYDGRLATGLCPRLTFAGDKIYSEDVMIDTPARIDRYWRPYHEKLDATLTALVDQHGHALLWDAHSIKSRVPRLFEGELPALNFGTWDNHSCSTAIADTVMAIAASTGYSVVLNGRFKGGYITRHYGRPEANVHAIQLELAQRTYMNETTLEYDKERSVWLRETLRLLLRTYVDAGAT